MRGFTYFSLPVDNAERAQQFYTNVFGWTFKLAWEYDTPSGRQGMWDVFTSAQSEPSGGMTPREFPGQPIGVGIEVESVDDVICAVEKNGGRVIMGKQQIPQRASFALCQDSEGNTFVAYQKL